jgi:hypothetical protein
LTNVSNSNIFGVVTANSPYKPVSGSTIGCYITSANANWLQLPYGATGNYMFFMQWTGTGAVAMTAPTISSVVNLTATSVLQASTTNFLNDSATADTYTNVTYFMIFSYAVNNNTPGSNSIIKFSLADVALPTSLTSAEIWVFKYPDTIQS